jgi:hypothetical protein
MQKTKKTNSIRTYSIMMWDRYKFEPNQFWNTIKDWSKSVSNTFVSQLK